MDLFSRYSDAPEPSGPEASTQSSAARKKQRKRTPLWVAIPLAVLVLLFGLPKGTDASNFLNAKNDLSEIPRVVKVSSNPQAVIVTAEDMGADLIRDVLTEWRSHGRVMNSYALTISAPGGVGVDDEPFTVSFIDPAIPNQSTLEAIEELA